MTAYLAALSLALGLASSAGPQATSPIQPEEGLPIVVQVVDAVWKPVPGATVALRAQAPDGETVQGITDEQGRISLSIRWPWVQAGFALAVRMPGFRPAQLRDLGFGSCAGDCTQPRYIQVQIEVSGRPVPVPIDSGS